MASRYYDSKNKRLIFIGDNADEHFWDSVWAKSKFPDCIITKKNPFIISNTSKYLPVGSKVLEGGCGKGDKVYAMQHFGYDAYGVDYASEVVEKINGFVPELKVSLGDIRNLDFPDGFFDGYWSLGVIEHFWDGYEPIAQEMYRVIKSGGYLFLTVPSMSPLRRLKVSLNLYKKSDDLNKLKDGFYQFALSPESVLENFSTLGFKLKETRARDGVKGLREEIPFLKNLLQWCWEAKSPIAKVLKKILQLMTNSFSGHMRLFIFQKC